MYRSMNLGRSASNAHRYTIESARWPSAAPFIVMLSSSRSSDDAASVHASRVNLFRQERESSGGRRTRVLVFPSAQAFLGSPRRHAPGCLVLDVRTGHGDIPMTVRAMKAGVREQDLLDAIRHAIDRDRVARVERLELFGRSGPERLAPWNHP